VEIVIFVTKIDMRTLAFQFNDIVEKIYSLPLEEKVELKNLLEHHISDVRRDEILLNSKKAMVENQLGKLKFSSEIDDLKKML
jgi:hypothetical protein